MILSQSDFKSKVSDVSKAAGLDIASAFELYKVGRSVDMKNMLAKNTKLKSIRNWYDTSNTFLANNGSDATVCIGGFEGYYDSQLNMSLVLPNYLSGYSITSTIKPAVSINSAGIAGGLLGYFEYYTNTAHGFVVGDTVNLRGFVSYPELNGTKTITQVINNFTFRTASTSTQTSASESGDYVSHVKTYQQLLSDIVSSLSSDGYSCYYVVETGRTKSGLQATLTSGSNKVTLTSGNTSSILPGDTITGVTGPGAFSGSAVVFSVDTSTTFTVTQNHTASGSVSFSFGGIESGTLVLKTSSQQGSCYYNNYVPTITTSNITPPSVNMSYSIPSTSSPFGFYGGVCSDLAGAFHESTALTGDQAEAMLNELRSSYNV